MSTTEPAAAKPCGPDEPCGTHMDTSPPVAAAFDPAEVARLREGARMLGRIIVGHTRAMEAARIELAQGSAEKAMEWILNSLPDVWEDEETEWDGRESANEWWDRTDAFYRAAETPAAAHAEAPLPDDASRARPAAPECSRERAAASLAEPAEHSTGIALIRAERARQVAVEGYTPEHDAEHCEGELALAAVSYALASMEGPSAAADEWPFDPASFKPGIGPLGCLAKAGALIAAELDRLIGNG